MAWRCGASRAAGDAARKPWAAAVPVAWANRRRASGSLDDAPHRLRPPFCPAYRPRDLYGSLSALLGISTNLAEFGTDWKSLARLLLVKGMSWAYEKEVRLLVDLEQASDIGKEDTNGWPIRVIEPPPEAIREIYGGANTRDADVDLAVQVARGENKKGLFVGQVIPPSGMPDSRWGFPSGPISDSMW